MFDVFCWLYIEKKSLWLDDKYNWESLATEHSLNFSRQRCEISRSPDQSFVQMSETHFCVWLMSYLLFFPGNKEQMEGNKVSLNTTMFISTKYLYSRKKRFVGTAYTAEKA